MAHPELISDARGSVLLGWIGTWTLYARFEQVISAEIASRFGKRIISLIGETAGVHYFVDSSAVVGYELSAFPFVIDAMLAKREQFKLIVVLPWAGPIGKRAHAFADAFGCVEYVTTAAEFDARLFAAAPRTSMRAVRVTRAVIQAADAEHAEPRGEPPEQTLEIVSAPRAPAPPFDRRQ